MPALIGAEKKARRVVAVKRREIPGTAAAAAPPRSYPKYHTRDGWAVVSIHHSVVPNYDYERACEGLSPEGIRQELELDWSATKGRRVFPEFSADRHKALEPLRFNPREPLYCGWDFGGTPAFVATQLNPFGQWFIFPAIAPLEETSIGIYEFGQLVADHLLRNYASPHGLSLRELKLVHYGDPAGKDRPPRTGDRPNETQSCFEILDKGLTLPLGYDARGRPKIHRQPGWGWKIMPGAVSNTERQAAVKARLKLSLRDGLPALVVDPRADVIVDGFSGGYHFPQRADGRWADEPLKNWYSHSMDALQYVATRLFAVPTEEEDDEEDVIVHEFRSHAAGRQHLVA